jgi:hypothetical protein
MEPLLLLDTGGDRSRDRVALADLLRAAGLGGRKGGIRCPRCRWEPDRASRWSCDCGMVWNTFETRGLCPACARQWTETSCPACHRWSRHEDWYEPEAGCPSSSR